eukprot:4422675-Amphidinium_carterae.1
MKLQTLESSKKNKQTLTCQVRKLCSTGLSWWAPALCTLALAMMSMRTPNKQNQTQCSRLPWSEEA